jgi:two-component system phosphate regulon sensor histidine kinase PhoR
MKAILSSLGTLRGSGPLAGAASVAAALALVALASGHGLVAAFLAGGAIGLALPRFFLPLVRDRIDPVPGRPEERRADALHETIGLLLDAVPVALIVIARNGRIVHANPEARRTLPRLPIGAHHASVLRAPEWVAAIGEALVDGCPRRITFAASPGRERLLDARIAPLPRAAFLSDGDGLLVMIEDRTEARRAEQLRSDFIANASHELRTPLASIVGYVETLQNHARDDPEARERFLAVMAREAGRMQRLVDDLMSLSRIEMSEHLRPEGIAVPAEIAAEAALALQPVAEAASARIEIDLPRSGAPAVACDRDQIYQVFSNLIDNAIKYGGPGVTIRVAEAGPSRAFPNRIGITVSDDGPGIAREHLPRLTERFYRASIGQSRHRGGTGLGLAIVKHILHRHEGKLEIVSTVGKGSAFTVWLPALPSDPS